MFKNPQIPAKALYPFCRSMGRMLESGVEVRKSLKTCSAHSPDPRLTSTVGRIIKDIQKGDDLTSAFTNQGPHYPPLFLDLLSVGEQTGSMPEVFNSLADYYEANVNRMKEFRSQIFWPVFQLFAAILIIGLLIYILGIIGSPNADGTSNDVLGLGLVGTSGAITWFVLCYGSIAAAFAAYIFVTRNATGKQALHPFLMMIPGVGYCMKTFAIARFSWCFSLTQRAGMSIKPSIESSLKATGNGAFVSAIPFVWDNLQHGETLADALKSTTLFPVEFLHIVETAEESGTVPEALERLSHRFDEDAHRAMTWLTNVIARIIWGLVACFIGYIVISFFMRYVAMINSFM
ncbi:MAG: type II secretion system F family protein [Fuerstiella sp.]